jgi:hypothetical protein
MPANDFHSVLTAAVADLTEHGFDSAERVAKWMRLLREAAERSLVSAASLEQQLRDHLGKTFSRMVDQGGLLSRHPGVPRFTYDRIKPALRAELDRRIYAAADLIKLNREEAINSTLRRFAGWSSSIPAGGTDQAQRRKVKKDVRKSLASLPFEERRVIIDQSMKLISSISDIVATDGGAIAGVWRSNWRQHGYDYREPHKERDGVVYLIRGSWAHAAGLVKPGGGGFLDDHERAGELPFCRCFVEYRYALRDLPADMLTAKGKAALEHARAVIRGQQRADESEVMPHESGTGCGGSRLRPVAFFPTHENSPLGATGGVSFDDAAEDLVRRSIASYDPQDHEDALRLAERADRLHYLRGIKSIRRTPDRTKWHAQYDPDRDEITVEDKLFREPIMMRVQTLVHEAGHRGQEVDPQTYAAFKAERFHKKRDFVYMANPAHIHDFEESGKVDGGLPDELFAESYSRYMLGLSMPYELKAFWDARIAQ